MEDVFVAGFPFGVKAKLVVIVISLYKKNLTVFKYSNNLVLVNVFYLK